MTIHVAGLIRLDRAPFKGNPDTKTILKHFKQAVPGDIEGNHLNIAVFMSNVIITGALMLGTEDIPRIEAWLSNRLATLKDCIITQAILTAEVHEPHVFYIWVRGQDPVIKAVAMEA